MSTMLPLDELNALRAQQEAALPDTCAIRRITRTSDGAGGFTSAETTVATVACRLGALGMGAEQGLTERLLAGRITLTEAAMLTLPYGTDVQLMDRMLLEGATWEVIATLERSWSTALRCIVARLRAT